MSRKPSVVIMPVRAPSCSSSPLVAIVVPWRKSSISDGCRPAAPITRRAPDSTPVAGSPTVVGTFSTATSPRSSSTTSRSVNVPPTSTPRRFIAPATRPGNRAGYPPQIPLVRPPSITSAVPVTQRASSEAR